MLSKPEEYRPINVYALTDLRFCGACEKSTRRLVTRLHKCPTCGVECCVTERREP